MQHQTNTFTKFITLIILLLIPILFIYSSAYKVSVKTIKKEIQSQRDNSLSYVISEFNSNINNLSMLAFLLSDDIQVKELQNSNSFTFYDQTVLKSHIQEKLRLINAVGSWDTQFDVIAPQIKQMVSTNPSADYDLSKFALPLSTKWKYRKMMISGKPEERFVRHIIEPHTMAAYPSKAGLIVQVSFSKQSIENNLDIYKKGDKGDPFIFSLNGGLITNQTANTKAIHRIMNKLIAGNPLQYNHQIIKLSGRRFLINIKKIDTLNWYLVDYVPLDKILQPISRNRNLFYFSILLLLILGVVATYFLYRNVQQPISILVNGHHHLKNGDYTSRISAKANNEFQFLFQSFNELASEIQHLIDKVYTEQIRSRDANLKQLQSQINPHFLYNSFALVRSLARLGKNKSVADLAMHLSKYYRYTTRLEKTSSTLQEELNLIKSYLEIQIMHIKKLNYTINVPDDMLELEIPRLLLQPLVENAVVHGIQKSKKGGLVQIIGNQNEEYNTLIVEDNGIGMTDGQLEKLRKTIATTPTNETGCALWNIQQRLTLQYGKTSSLSFMQLKDGGLRVIIQWSRKEG